MTLALVMVAAAVGAPLRYVVDQAVQHHWPGAFPAGTLTINLSGSCLLGLLTGLAAQHGLAPQAVTVLGTGLLGAYTTFSTFNYETVRLLEDGAVAEAALNVVGSLALGLAAAAAGLGLALLS
ncbi:MAG TPA: fluoride efflux transporter CrcB [Mycobacteriales bacterium]|nr:fluoride efflux transporter CrcB [Mycobacteriales bacterium]